MAFRHGVLEERNNDMSILDCLNFPEDRWVHAVTELYGKRKDAVNSHVIFLANYLQIAYNKCKGDDDFAQY